MFLSNTENQNQFINTNTTNNIFLSNVPFAPINSLSGTGENFTNKLDQVWTAVNTEINDFLQLPDWEVKTRLAITGDWLATEAKDFFSHISPSQTSVEILPANNMPGIAGGYDAITGKIYLSEDLVKYSDTAKIAQVLIEEIGHKADDILNPGQDSPGDEGEVLAKLISNQGSIPADWQVLKQENDHKLITIENTWHKVEAASVIPNISIASIILQEGDLAGQTNAVFQVTLDQITDQNVTLKYTTTDVNAKSGSDFIAKQDSINFSPGEKSKEIVIPIISDKLVENEERFLVNLSEPINGRLAKLQATATINNDDLPNISVGNLTIKEGNEGEKNAQFKIELDQPINKPVTLKYKTVDGSADSATDFRPQSGTIEFPSLWKAKFISIPLKGDTSWEADETFSIELSDANNGIITNSQAIGTITNDDFPKIFIEDSTIVEGNAGETNAQFKVKLDQPIGQELTVKYKTNAASAVAENDFRVVQEGEIKFLAGEIEQTINIPIIGDTNVEADEKFTVQLSQQNIGKLQRSQAIGIITNDDFPNISIGDVKIMEGNLGEKNAKFEVALDQKINQTVIVKYTTVGLTATTGNDFGEQQSQIDFLPGWLKKVITIPIKGDTLVETNETFAVELGQVITNNANVTKLQGIGTIENDDVPHVSIGDVTIQEGNIGETNAQFKVTLDQPTDQTVRVKYKTSGLSATVGNDFQNQEEYIEFPAGITETFINIPIIGDTLWENDEQFSVQLSQPENAKLTMGQSQGTGIITNDDTKRILPKISIENTNVIEGNSGQKNAKFKVNLDRVSDQIVTVEYKTIEIGSTKAGSDFQAKAGQIQFQPGQKEQTINVPILGDKEFEYDEKFVVKLSKPDKGVILKNQATGIIISDDYIPISEKEPDNNIMNNNIPTFTNLIPQDISVSGNIGLNSGGTRDTNDYYRLVLDKSNKEYKVAITLEGLLDNAQLAIYDKEGNIVNTSEKQGTQPEILQELLPNGNYYVRVYPKGGAKTPYTLSMKRVITEFN